jgi:hypothetical protein
MPDDTSQDSSGECFLLPPISTGAKVGTKHLDGLKEAAIASHILILIAKLPAKTPGVTEIKLGAIALAQAGGAKLTKAK